MTGHTHRARRVHLLVDPEKTDVLLVMTDASGPELTPVVPVPLSDSYRRHSSRADATTAS
jgi:hypothetical protein